MSLSRKRTLDNTINENKRWKNDSAIDLNFDLGEVKAKKSQSTSMSSELLIEDDSMLDDDVFEDEQSVNTFLSKSASQIDQSRKRLNGTSTDRSKRKKNKRSNPTMNKENVRIDQALNQLRDEQARIDAHSLSVNIK